MWQKCADSLCGSSQGDGGISASTKFLVKERGKDGGSISVNGPAREHSSQQIGAIVINERTDNLNAHRFTESCEARGGIQD